MAHQTLTPKQRAELHTWFDAGVGIPSAVKKALEKGWKVGKTVVGEEKKAWRLLRQAGQTTPTPGSASPGASVGRMSPAEAHERTLFAMVRMAEQPEMDPQSRIGAARVVAALVEAVVEEEEGEEGASPAAPFQVGSKN